MSRANFETQRTETALLWMLNQNMIVKRSTKDPETFATVNGFLLSDELRGKMGANLVKLFAKVTSRRNDTFNNVSVRDAFLTAAIGAVLEMGQVSLSEEEMMRCANIVMALLPFRHLEREGIASKPLRSLAHDKILVGKIQRACVHEVH